MGANYFVVDHHGGTPAEAFSAAYDQACWEHGHGGYSGTLAEKDCFTTFTVPEGTTLDQALEYAEAASDPDSDNELVQAMAKGVDDKWGPAGHIQVGEDHIFFGWASC